MIWARLSAFWKSNHPFIKTYLISACLIKFGFEIPWHEAVMIGWMIPIIGAFILILGFAFVGQWIEYGTFNPNAEETYSFMTLGSILTFIVMVAAFMAFHLIEMRSQASNISDCVGDTGRFDWDVLASREEVLNRIYNCSPDVR